MFIQAGTLFNSQTEREYTVPESCLLAVFVDSKSRAPMQRPGLHGAGLQEGRDFTITSPDGKSKQRQILTAVATYEAGTKITDNLVPGPMGGHMNNPPLVYMLFRAEKLWKAQIEELQRIVNDVDGKSVTRITEELKKAQIYESLKAELSLKFDERIRALEDMVASLSKS